MRLIGYVRRSDANKQGDNGSRDQQIARLEGWCRLYNHELVDILKEDESGKTVHGRPVFKGVLNRILKKDDADGLLVMKLDRFSRDEADAHLIKRSFDKAGKVIVCTDEPINTAEAHGDIIFGLLVSLAAAEHKTIVARFQRGIKHQRETGRDMTAVPRYGYKRVGKGKDSQIVQDQNERVVIGMILDLAQSYADGVIARELNHQKRFTRHGKQWTAKQVRRIIDAESQTVAACS